MDNYTKISDSLLQNTELKLTSRVIYARLAYRMNLSVHNDKAYFDEQGHFYYIVYQLKDLMHDCGLGRHAVIDALKQLVKVGLVIKHSAKHFTRVTHLELPKFGFDTSESHKTESVKKTNKNKINKSDSNSDRRLKRIKDRWNHTNIPKIDPKLDHQNATKAIKFRQIPKLVIKHIQTMLNGKAFTRCIHILLQARKSVLRDYKRSNNNYYCTNLLKYALNFDCNDYYTYNHSKDFTRYIDHGLRKAWHDSKPGKLWHYFMKVCKTYYKHAVTWFYQNRDSRITDGPRIPIFKI